MYVLLYFVWGSYEGFQIIGIENRTSSKFDIQLKKHFFEFELSATKYEECFYYCKNYLSTECKAFEIFDQFYQLNCILYYNFRDLGKQLHFLVVDVQSIEEIYFFHDMWYLHQINL